MRVFVTGATGYIGSVVSEYLLNAGHQVLGLARSEDSARRLRSMGAEPHLGDLDDPESLATGSASADGVIHTAISLHGFDSLDLAFAKDRNAVEAMVSALAGTGRPFLYTSGSGVLADTGAEAVDESVAADDTGPVAARAAVERAVLEAQSHQIRTVVIRSGLVYGRAGSGFVYLLADLARQAGGPRTIGDGGNVCSAVHVDDLADLYVRALERGPAGTLFNAASEEEPTMLDIAEAVGRTMKLTRKATVWPVDEARASLGPFADGLAANKRISATRARETLGWAPHHMGLIDELERGSYPRALNSDAG